MDGKFQVLGYFETLYDPSTNKTLGNRLVPEDPARKIGYAGRREITVTEDFTLASGHKTVTVKIQEPRKLVSMVYPVCGRIKNERSYLPTPS